MVFYKKVINLLIICLLMFMPFSVFAEEEEENSSNEASLEVVCPPIVLSNNEFSCDVFLHDLEKSILGVSLEYSIPSGFAFISFEESEGLSVDGSSSVSTVLTSDRAIDVEKVGEIVLKSSSDVEIGDDYDIVFKSKIVYEDNVDEFVELDNVTVNVINQNLTNLINYINVNDENIDVDDDSLEYSVGVDNDVTSAKIVVSFNNEISDLGVANSNMNINDLKVGSNLYQIDLTYNGKEFLTLTLDINRKNSDGKVVSNSTNENIDENPKTGLSVFSVLAIMVMSFCLIVIYRRNQLKGES